MQTTLPPPMRIGQLMDRVFRLLPKLIVPIIPISIAMSALATLSAYLNIELHQSAHVIRTLLLFIPLTIIQWILFYYFLVLTTVMSDELWLFEKVTVTASREKVTFGKMLRAFTIGWVILLASLAWAILLIIPGIIYFMNRIPAINVMLLEGAPIRESLRKSKFLMTYHPGIPWWSFSTPVMRISAIMLVSMVLNLMPAIISGTNAFFSAFEGQMTALSPLDHAINFFASFLTMIFSTFGYLAGVGFYYDLRTRTQGLDLQHEISSLKTSI